MEVIFQIGKQLNKLLDLKGFWESVSDSGFSKAKDNKEKKKMGIPSQSIWAAGAVAVGGTFTAQRGCASVALGSSIYSVTLTNEIDASECVVLATPRGTTARLVVCNHTSDSVKAFATFDAAVPAAADAAFDFVIHPLN